MAPRHFGEDDKWLFGVRRPSNFGTNAHSIYPRRWFYSLNRLGIFTDLPLCVVDFNCFEQGVSPVVPSSSEQRVSPVPSLSISASPGVRFAIIASGSWLRSMFPVYPTSLSRKGTLMRSLQEPFRSSCKVPALRSPPKGYT